MYALLKPLCFLFSCCFFAYVCVCMYVCMNGEALQVIHMFGHCSGISKNRTSGIGTSSLFVYTLCISTYPFISLFFLSSSPMESTYGCIPISNKPYVCVCAGEYRWPHRVYQLFCCLCMYCQRAPPTSISRWLNDVALFFVFVLLLLLLETTKPQQQKKRE